MVRRRNNARWLQEHCQDPYVKQAQERGYRSRAVFKLKEIQERDRIFRPGATVVDLGAAPGGWSQLAQEYVGRKGRVFALDILPMVPLPSVEFIQGDFREDKTLALVRSRLKGCAVALVLSDMAPNISGMRVVDQPRVMALADLALDLAREVLAPGGDLLVKVFQGCGFLEYQMALRACFRKVVVRKPKASRAKSREVYFLARGYNV